MSQSEFRFRILNSVSISSDGMRDRMFSRMISMQNDGGVPPSFVFNEDHVLRNACIKM